MNPDRTSLDWVAARKRHHLSHAQVQMARELGLNPNKLGRLDNHHQELWKAPLPRHIEHLYEERFGKTQTDILVTVEQRMAASARRRRLAARRRSSVASKFRCLGGWI